MKCLNLRCPRLFQHLQQMKMIKENFFFVILEAQLIIV